MPTKKTCTKTYNSIFSWVSRPVFLEWLCSDSEPKTRRRDSQPTDFLGSKSKECIVNSSVCADGSVDELKENNSVELRNSRKKPGHKATWDYDILDDLASVTTENLDYTDKLIFRNTTNVYNSVTYQNIIKEVKKKGKKKGVKITYFQSSKLEINLRKWLLLAKKLQLPSKKSLAWTNLKTKMSIENG